MLDRFPSLLLMTAQRQTCTTTVPLDINQRAILPEIDFSHNLFNCKVVREPSCPKVFATLTPFCHPLKSYRVP